MKTPSFFARSDLTATLWGFRHAFALVALFSAVANVLLLTPTIYMLQLYDRVLISGSELTLLAVSLVCLFLFGIMSVSEWARSRVLVAVGTRLDALLGTRVFNASFESYLNGGGTGTARAFSDLLVVRQFITGSGLFAFLDAPWVPVYVAVMFMLHPLLGVMALVFAAIQVLLAWLGHSRTVAPNEEAAKATTDSNVYVLGKLRNAEVLESMGMVENLRVRWQRIHQRALGLSMSALAQTGRVQAWSKFIRYTQQSLALAAGAVLVINGELSAGAMIAANVLMNRALAPIDQLVSSWRPFINARAAFVRLEALLQQYPERDASLSRVAPKGEVTLRHVVASAPGRQAPILKDIGFHIGAGSVVAVLGPSGSGKSTLARVLMGIWPGVNGEVLIDGLPIASWDRVELGPHVGYLPQDMELFDGTIAENIARFGEIDSAKVIEAARITGLHEMILRFPAGYDTPMGEGGNMLSGGQRQRIGLARAIYGKPALVVLDEPNANLDDLGEAALMQTVRQLKAEGRTVFLITHRPGIVSVADHILVLRDGVLVQDGPRDQVLAALQPPQQARPAAEPGPLAPRPA